MQKCVVYKLGRSPLARLRSFPPGAGVARLHPSSLTGRIKLSDFGVGGELEDTMASTRTFVGTVYYMAPEVWANTRGGWHVGVGTYVGPRGVIQRS